MAYGDNRSEVASDTFGSSIDGNWSNGDGDWAALVWITGGHVGFNNGGGGTDGSIRRSAGTYADDQYARTTVQSHSGNSWVGAAARMQSGTDESAYVGFVQGSEDDYEIVEYNSSFGFSALASTTDPGSEIPHSSGDIVTIEAEGTTIRMGSDQTGSDAQKVTTTDATLSSGDPGLVLFCANGNESNNYATAWSGGDISAASPITIAVPVGPLR